MEPTLEHYCCVVDALAREGNLSGAEDISNILLKHNNNNNSDS